MFVRLNIVISEAQLRFPEGFNVIPSKSSMCGSACSVKMLKFFLNGMFSGGFWRFGAPFFCLTFSKMISVENFFFILLKVCNFERSRRSLGVASQPVIWPKGSNQFFTTAIHMFILMKTTRIPLLLTAFLLFPWCLTLLSAQQEGSKKVVITKETVEADGSRSSETLVKKGAAAEQFDVDKYIQENRGDNTRLQIDVTQGDNEQHIEVEGARARADEPADNEDEEDDGDDLGLREAFSSVDKAVNGAYLGVNKDSDEKPSDPGVVIEVVRGSAADRAGLRDNDKILQLNETRVDRWNDLSNFINAAKPGDKVRIAYERNGKAATTEATLTRLKDVNCNFVCEKKGFLGVSGDNSGVGDATGLKVRITKGSAAEMAGLQNGDILLQLNDTPIVDFEDVTDFMAYTKPGDKVSVVYERQGRRNTIEATLGTPKESWDAVADNLRLDGLNLENLGRDLNESLNLDKMTVNVREKDACLGVFSDNYAENGVEGTQISDFTEESAARDMSLQQGDVITAVNGQAVKDHDDLWNEIAKYKIGEQVKVDYIREGQSMSVSVALKGCHDNSSRVQILDNEGQPLRNFTSWNWNEDDQRRLRERKIITIRKGEGDAPKMDNSKLTQDRSLQLTDFKAYPNPTQGQVTVEFRGAPVATTVSFFDLAGRQLFCEEMNAFNGRYSQQFDLSAYAKGAIIIRVQQGDKYYTDQMMVN